MEATFNVIINDEGWDMHTEFSNCKTLEGGLIDRSDYYKCLLAIYQSLTNHIFSALGSNENLQSEISNQINTFKENL